VEPSRQMLQIAEEYCRANIRHPASVQSLCANIEAVTETRLRQCVELPITFVNASASLHHLQRTAKIAALRLLSNLCKFTFVSELEGNHEELQPLSPEIVFSVLIFYGTLVADTTRSILTEVDLESCRDGFLMAEAFLILGGTRESRGDYHTTKNQWGKIITASGSESKVVAYEFIGRYPLRIMTLSALRSAGSTTRKC